MSLKSDLTLPSDGIKIQTTNVKAFIGDKQYGSGVLCIAEKLAPILLYFVRFILDCSYFVNNLNYLSCLIWRQEDGNGLCFSYPMIALHAISSDLNAFPHECLYMIVDKEALANDQEGAAVSGGDGGGNNNDNEDNVSDESDEIQPIRFVPEDKTYLNPIFKAINECQAMHPDPEDMSSGEEEEDEEAEGDENGVGYDDEENDFRDADEEENFEEASQELNSNLENVELSDRGRQILRRLNINYEAHSN
jgi:nucleotide-sensitive chloride channel 1A